MKNLVIAAVLIALAPSFGLAGQIDRKKCIDNNNQNRATLAAQDKGKVEKARKSNSSSTSNSSLERD